MTQKKILLVGILLSTNLIAATANWEQIGDENGIKTYKKEVPGSPFIAMKGEGIVDAPLWKVATVMEDVTRETEWVDSLSEAKLVRRISPYECIEWDHVGTPFVMKDRDFVTKSLTVIDLKAKSVLTQIKSVEEPGVPPTRYIRGIIQDSSFLLKSIDEGRKTYVVGELQADPKGSIAAWLVNLFQKSWARETLESIRKQCSKNDIQVLPIFQPFKN
jgi:hypothetical protein